MSKILFNVKLPVTDCTYDFWVPNDMPMQQISDLVASALELAAPEYCNSAGDNALMYVQTGQIQNPNACPAELGFTDGDKFVLL